MKNTTKQRELALSAALLFMTGCVGSELEVPANHPGNPGANTGKVSSSTALGKEFDLQLDEGEASEPAAHSPAQQTPDGATHVCPMHPEIVRKEPGKCPICGMKLVPKKEAK